MLLLNLMRNSFKAALCGVLALSLVVSSVPHARAQMGEDGLVMSVSVTGPAGAGYSVNIRPGVNNSGTFGSGAAVLDDVQIGFPDSLNGTINLPIHYAGQTRGTVNLNFVWDRFAGTILFSGQLSPYAVLNVTANGTSTQLRSNDGGTLPANANVTPGDFQAGASLVTIEVLNTTRAGNGERVSTDPVSLSIGMGLPPLSIDGGKPATSGGSKGKGFNIGFAIKALFGAAVVKSAQTFVKSMRSMSQQETTTRMATLATESTLNDAQEVAEDALVRQEMNARLTRELMPEEQVAIGACTIKNMDQAEEQARATQGVIADANQRQELLESDGRNVCARVPEDTMSDEMRRMCGVSARKSGETTNTLNADQYVTQTRDVTGAAAQDETAEERSLRQFLDLLTDSHRPLAAVANLNAEQVNEHQYVDVLDARSLEAQQTLVKSTFHRMFADRTSGASESRQTLEDVLKRQNYDNETVNKLIGTKPSYWSQREIMAKMRYQDPNFYSELQGKSESQLRAVHTSIEAQKSMVWRDLYTSVRQRELLLAQILEMKLRAQSESVNRQLSSVSDK